MKTRIVYTKIWKDEYFRSLKSSEKILFFYFFTNEYVNQIWLYECPDDVISFETSVPIKEVQKIKEKLQMDKKIVFYKSYVYLVNSNKYEDYRGDKNEIAKKKIISLINKDVLDWYNNILDRGIDRGIDTQQIPSIIHNTESINNKLGVVKGNFTTFESLTDLILEEIANKYQVPLSFVKSKLDDMKLWHEQNPKRNNKQNWKATLMNWVKTDALKIIAKERQTINSYKPTEIKI